MLTDRGAFVGLVQHDESLDDLLHTYVDKAPTKGEDASPENGLGVDAWQTWSDQGGDHAFSTELSCDVTSTDNRNKTMVATRDTAT